MSGLKDLIGDAPVHERKLEFKSFPLEDGRLVVEGWLRDERLIEGHHWNGEPRPPGVVHWIGVRLLLGEYPLKILDAEAEMPQVPHRLCPTTCEAVRKLIGLSIVSGYSDRVRRLVGGVNGCSHMTHLLVAMGPAALHGYWTELARKKRPLPRSRDDIPGLPYVRNSCRLWREDGPLMQMVADFFEEQEADGSEQREEAS